MSIPGEMYEQVLADHARLVRELDVILNGEAGAAEQASLVDIVSQCRQRFKKPPFASDDRTALEAALLVIMRLLHTHQNREPRAAYTIAELLVRAQARGATDDELGEVMNTPTCETCGKLAVWKDAEGDAWCDEHRHSMVARI